MAGKNSTIIRTTVERDVYLRADRLAKERGTNLSAVLRTLLIDWSIEAEPIDPDIKPEQAVWLRLTEWMNLNGFSRPDGLRTKGELLKWAKARGFKG